MSAQRNRDEPGGQVVLRMPWAAGELPSAGVSDSAGAGSALVAAAGASFIWTSSVAFFVVASTAVSTAGGASSAGGVARPFSPDMVSRGVARWRCG